MVARARGRGFVTSLEVAAFAQALQLVANTKQLYEFCSAASWKKQLIMESAVSRGRSDHPHMARHRALYEAHLTQLVALKLKG